MWAWGVGRPFQGKEMCKDIYTQLLDVFEDWQVLWQEARRRRECLLGDCGDEFGHGSRTEITMDLFCHVQ